MTLTRQDMDKRSKTVWRQKSVGYSQGELHEPDKYRKDCAGYVSMCWDIPLDTAGSWGGLSTVTLLSRKWMFLISNQDLKLGDAVGMCGPGTGGNNGHIIFFVRWLNHDPNDSRFIGREQAGGTMGWVERTFDWPDGYASYRRIGITEDDGSDTTPAELPNVVYYSPPPAIALGSRLLSQGSYGTDVMEAQQLLNATGAGLLEDGDFGPATEGATRAFQASRGLLVDGIIGPQTISALRSSLGSRLLSRGSQGSDVVDLQRLLNMHGAGLAVDGDFGPRTEAAVRAYQASAGLDRDGIAGPLTVRALRA